MSNKDYLFLEKKAEVLKAFSHPVRLSILRDLALNGEKRVSDMETNSDIPLATVSQHLVKMYNTGFFNKRRNGIEIYYSLKDDKVIKEFVEIFLK